MAETHDPGRRQVLVGLAAGIAAAAAPLPAGSATSLDAPMPMFQLGKAGIRASKFVLGGWHVGPGMDEAAARSLVARAFDLGVRFFDSAHSYGGSEERLGTVLSTRRKEVVLMSKSFQRDAAGSARELAESLRRLKTDHVDLWQFHSINHREDVDAIVAKGGALETARAALADGRIRVLGATSHNSPEGLLALVERVPEIEVVQFPVNCVDRHWRSFIDAVVPVAKQRGLAMLAMKTLALGKLSGLQGISVAEAHRYALSQPIAAWVSGVTSIPMLEENVALAKEWKVLTEAEQADLLRRSKPHAGVKTEYYKRW